MVLDKKKTGGENFLKKVFSPRPPLSKTFDVIESVLAGFSGTDCLPCRPGNGCRPLEWLLVHSARKNGSASGIRRVWNRFFALIPSVLFRQEGLSSFGEVILSNYFNM